MINRNFIFCAYCCYFTLGCISKLIFSRSKLAAHNWSSLIGRCRCSFSIIGLKTCSDNCKYLILVGSILGFCFHSPRSQYLLSKSSSNVRVVWENVSSLWLRVFPLTASQIDGDIIGDRTFSRIILFSQSYKSHFYVGLFILTHCHRVLSTLYSVCLCLIDGNKRLMWLK